jgi:hypothetical protein
MFLRKDATKHLVKRVDKLIRKTTIYAKIALLKGKSISSVEISKEKIIKAGGNKDGRKQWSNVRGSISIKVSGEPTVFS